MNAYPIEISQLSKDFGKTRVLNNVNLTSLEELFLEFYQDGQGKPQEAQGKQGNQNQQQEGASRA